MRAAIPSYCARVNISAYAVDIHTIGLGSDDNEICRNIYAAMHAAEKSYDCIICEDLGDSGLLGSVMNRVNKSAGGK